MQPDTRPPTPHEPAPPAKPGVPLAQLLDLLRRTPAVLRSLLAGSAPAWHEPAHEGPATWSARQVVGHLIYTDEEVWLVRAATLRAHGETQPFAPGDASIHLARFADTPLAELLDRFAVTREASLATVRGWNLDVADLQQRGRHTHYGVVTLGELLATWVAHDLTHVTQISRVLAKRLTTEVGSWRESLSILDPRPPG
jgi:hypothetical protein